MRIANADRRLRARRSPHDATFIETSKRAIANFKETLALSLYLAFAHSSN
jgi:hypothetical protein